MIDMPAVSLAAAPSLRDDARTIGLVGAAHATSHFFHLLLPTLYPWMMSDFDLNFAQLGLLVSIFFVVSAVGQAVSGFIVDRVGAQPVLVMALALFALSACAVGIAQGYVGLMLGAALAGLGNAPFHPVDFTILNRRVSARRLAHAFAAHGVTGNLGWAVAPVFLVGIASVSGSWRVACAGAACIALVVLVAVHVQRQALDDRRQAESDGGAGAVGPRGHVLSFLTLRSVWMCFLFFFFSTMALSAIQSFAAPALQAMHDLPLVTASLVVSGYTFAGAVGMLFGGFLAAWTTHHERVIGACLLGAAALLFWVGLGTMGGSTAVVLASVAGLGGGLAGPSRDLLIRRAAPAGATGRVYGTVYSGLDLGFAISAPVLGALMDHGMPGAVFHVAAATLVAGVLAASMVGSADGVRR